MSRGEAQREAARAERLDGELQRAKAATAAVRRKLKAAEETAKQSAAGGRAAEAVCAAKRRSSPISPSLVSRHVRWIHDVHLRCHSPDRQPRGRAGIIELNMDAERDVRLAHVQHSYGLDLHARAVQHALQEERELQQYDDPQDHRAERTRAEGEASCACRPLLRAARPDACRRAAAAAQSAPPPVNGRTARFASVTDSAAVTGGESPITGADSAIIFGVVHVDSDESRHGAQRELRRASTRRRVTSPAAGARRRHASDGRRSSRGLSLRRIRGRLFAI